jgi:lipoprotein-anchoring transpeptidase ErfK/SrfK
MQIDLPENQSEAAQPQGPDQPASAQVVAGRHVGRWLGILLAAVILAGVATAGYLVVMARANGSGASLPLAPIPGLTPSSPGSTVAPQRQHWIVVCTQGRPVKVYLDPSKSAKVVATVPTKYAYNVPSVMLVQGEPTLIAGQTWYDVLLPIPPIYSEGWVPGSSVRMYVVYTMIKVDLSARTLSVIEDQKVIGQFPVAIGRPATPTPTGTFFVAQKVNATNPNTVYGPYALGLSAFAPALASQFPPDGQVAIHGWRIPSDIGQAVSHGCIRMKLADMAWVIMHVSTGSPVVIQQ